MYSEVRDAQLQNTSKYQSTHVKYLNTETALVQKALEMVMIEVQKNVIQFEEIRDLQVKKCNN